MKLNKILYVGVLATGMLATSCEDFLDRAPISSLTPENYYKQESELAAYTTNYYGNVFSAPGGGYNAGPINWDDETDNMVVGGGNTSYFDHQWLVGAGEALDFGFIRVCNYFFQQVLPKYEAGQIQGSPENIKHYIGEMYFMRAMAYFAKLKNYGDFPIITEVLPDDMATLREASKRAPRNEVAKFIISDLEKAESMLKSGADFGKNRIGKELATLVKARVALYEATFLKYHSGTPRVPGEAGWPGADKAYNSGKSFNIASDVDYFLGVAMEASKEIADATTLTPNNGVINPEVGQITGWNEYFEMFSMANPSGLSEVIFWRDYDKGQSILHGWVPYLQEGGNNGMTKSYVDAFLMANGLPIYAANSGYQGDETIDQQKADRDGRLQLFVFGESMLTHNDPGGKGVKTFDAPGFLFMTEHRDLTGFRQRKHYTYDQIQISDGINGTNGFVEYRGAEAYLIYLEASFLKEGKINSTADGYWRALRTRAGVDPDYTKTIAATDLTKEPDWAKYSGSTLVDETLYNIRRERRCEFIGEGFRWDDLIRWRAFDGLLPGGEFEGYQPEGVNFWTSMYKHESYYDNGVCNLVEQAPGEGAANISSREVSKYARPYMTIMENNQLWDGLKWQKAHYLAPLGVNDLILTSEDGSIANSVSYQNPYWPTTASEAAAE